MKTFLTILLFSGYCCSLVAQAPAPMAIDSAYFVDHLKTSYWELPKEDAEGWIGCVGFMGDTIVTMMINFAKGGGADRCTYSYQLKGNYMGIKIGDCRDGSPKSAFWVYWADEKTMYVGTPRKKKYVDPQKIPAEDWIRFTWMDPATIEED